MTQEKLSKSFRIMNTILNNSSYGFVGTETNLRLSLEELKALKDVLVFYLSEGFVGTESIELKLYDKVVKIIEIIEELQ